MMTELIIVCIAIGILWWLLRRNGVLGPKKFGIFTEKHLKELAVYSLGQADITPDVDENYDGFLQAMVENAKDVLTDPNPVVRNRHFLAEGYYKFSRLRVLLLTPDEANYLLQHEAISGELKPFLHEAIENNPELYKIFKTIPQSSWEDRAIFYALCAFAQLDFHERMRHLVNDMPAAEHLDWRHGALMAACVWAEDCYREILDLPRFVNFFERYIYGSLLVRVEEGHKDPRAVWEAMIEDCKKESRSFDRIKLVGCN